MKSVNLALEKGYCDPAGEGLPRELVTHLHCTIQALKDNSHGPRGPAKGVSLVMLV